MQSFCCWLVFGGEFTVKIHYFFGGVGLAEQRPTSSWFQFTSKSERIT